MKLGNHFTKCCPGSPVVGVADFHFSRNVFRVANYSKRHIIRHELLKRRGSDCDLKLYPNRASAAVSTSIGIH